MYIQFIIHNLELCAVQSGSNWMRMMLKLGNRVDLFQSNSLSYFNVFYILTPQVTHDIPFS